jgi:hypothetical protein
MSEIVGLNVAPESTLRFSAEELYAAGSRLGLVESTMQSPKTTFEDLQRRAEELDRRIGQRKVQTMNLFRRLAFAISVFGAVAFAGSFILDND